MTSVLSHVVAFLVWPGLLVAAPLAWAELWLMRKIVARLQGRKGPPFFQPFFDFVKLMGKRTVIPEGVDRDRKSTRLNSSHEWISRMPSSA